MLRTCILVILLTLISIEGITAQIFSKESQQPKQLDTISKLQLSPFVHGTLQTPSNASAEHLVIFIMGSGDVDRDGNQATSKRNTFIKMSNQLASRGVSSFRYDKRIIPMLKQQMDFSTITFNDFIDDAQLVIDYFKNQNRFKKIYLAGHSQGALVATIAAQQSAVDGVITLAGTARPIDEVIVKQLEDQMGMGDQAKEAFETLKTQGYVTDYNRGLSSIFNPQIQPFMRSWMQYNPVVEIAKLDKPTLIIQGTKDLQVPESDATLLVEHAQSAKLELFEDMNHVLVTIQGDELENAKSYNESWRPLTNGLVEAIVTFVKTN